MYNRIGPDNMGQSTWEGPVEGLAEAAGLGERVWDVAHEEMGVHISSGGSRSFQQPVRVSALVVRVEKYGRNIMLLPFLCTFPLVTLSPRHQSHGTSVEAAVALPSRCALWVCPSAAQPCRAQLPD